MPTWWEASPESRLRARSGVAMQEPTRGGSAQEQTPGLSQGAEQVWGVTQSPQETVQYKALTEV